MGTETDVVAAAQASYERCLRKPQFLHHFYDTLLASDDQISAIFEKTEFKKQTRLLQHAIGLLFIYAKRPNPVLLERLAERHSNSDLDIDPAFYENWVDSLVETAEQHDPEFTPEVGEAWRESMKPGVDYMISKY
jgi:hemoglobin-like flavoprotein